MTSAALQRSDAAVPVVEWRDWWRYFAERYRVSRDSADHVTIIGPTGTGKTTLAMQIATLRRYTVALGTKPRDDPFRRMLREGGYVVQSHGDLPSPRFHPHVCVWPRYTGIESEADQRDIFGETLQNTFTAGGWHLVIEEGAYLCDELKMARRIRSYYRFGRSNSTGIILCTQRPRFIPLECLSGAQHVIVFGTNDVEDLRRLGGLNGADSNLARTTVARLGREYDFVHIDTRTGAMTISRFPKG